MPSRAKEASAESKEEEAEDSNSVMEDSNSVSSKPEDDNKQQPRVARKKGSKASATTFDSTSRSATASVVVRQPESQSGLPTFAAAAAAAAPQLEKGPRKAGLRNQFLPMLRVMLDRESQKDNTIVHWSAEGNSFIVTDPKKFEADIYPAYFDCRIIFTTFLSKLYRWGFSRLSSKSGRYEFRSPTFSKFSSDSAPATAAAAAAAAADTSKSAGGSASIQVQQQQQQQHQKQQHQSQGASPLQQVMELTNQPSVPPNPLLPTQVDGIAALISNIQRSRQQSSVVSSQQSVLNSQLNMNHSLQPFQQLQHSNRTTDLLNTVLSAMAGSQAPSAHLMGYSSPSSQSSSLLSLLTSSSTSETYPNTNTTPTIFQSDNNAIQSLIMLVHRVCEGERRRLIQVNATQNAIIATIGQLFGVSNTIDEAERRGLVAALGQALGSTGERTTPHPNVPLTTRHTGMNVGVPHAAASSGQMHQSIQQSSPGSLNFQVDRSAAILQAARRQDDDDNYEGTEDRPLPPRKRRSTDDGYGDDNPKKK